MKKSRDRGFTVPEYLVAIILVALIVIYVVPPIFYRISAHRQQTNQINNAFQIAFSCHLFANDNAGVFPSGKYDPVLDRITAPILAVSAEACFNDIFEAGKLNNEKIFWSPPQKKQCAQTPPTENGFLEAGENGWDFVAGLNNSSSTSIPLIFEASDGGAGKTWSRSGGHPWDDTVIVGYIDGSIEKIPLNANGQLEVERDGSKIDLCVPTPRKNRWPDDSKIAPATPAPEA